MTEHEGAPPAPSGHPAPGAVPDAGTGAGTGEDTRGEAQDSDGMSGWATPGGVGRAAAAAPGDTGASDPAGAGLGAGLGVSPGTGPGPGAAADGSTASGSDASADLDASTDPDSDPAALLAPDSSSDPDSDSDPDFGTGPDSASTPLSGAPQASEAPEAPDSPDGPDSPAHPTRSDVWRRSMTGRDRAERHRVATSLELFFDLCFVGAVSQAADQLADFLGEGRFAHGAGSFAVVFFAIWWAWVNFSWFASAYDTDDVLYRAMVLVQIGGGLVLAAGVPKAMVSGDLSIAVAGYVVMRAAMVGQWLRAARDDPPRRATALQYAAGIALVQTGWVLRLILAHGTAGVVWFAILAAADLLVPVWAERRVVTPWHPHHIAERYGLFTIIVLGESVLAATRAVQVQVSGGGPLGTLGPVAAGGLLAVFGMWWFYFAIPAHDFLSSNRIAFLWGYGHYLILASAAAVGAGLGVVITQSTGHAQIPGRDAAATVTIPVAVYLASVWALHLLPYAKDRLSRLGPPLAAAGVLAATFCTQPVLAAGLVVAALIGAFLVVKMRS